MSLIRDLLGNYTTGKTAVTETEVLAAAEDILRRRVERLGSLNCPGDAAAFLRMRLAGLNHEEFHAVWLDQRHRILDVQRLFVGMVGSAAVYPREVVRAALARNAAAVVFSPRAPKWAAGTQPGRPGHHD